MNGFDFDFDLFWMAWHWKPAIAEQTLCDKRDINFIWKNLHAKVHLSLNKDYFKNDFFFPSYIIITLLGIVAYFTS